MMANKHLLHDLLQEDQEPFLLKNYIADRCSQLKRPLSKTQDLQLKKRKPISQNSNFPSNFCKNACFFSFHDSPDVRKSPLFDFPSPAGAKSPSCKSPNTIFLHIPARTAALLLEAALRIQKNSSSSKPKTQNKNASFGLFGSLLKRLTHRKNRTRKREIGGDDGVKVSVKDILRWDSSVGRRKFSEKVEENFVGLEERSASEVGFSCSCNGRLSSAVWSESNEEKSLDLETSSSSSNSVDSEEIEFVSKERENGDFASCENGFCKSPFHFLLQKSTSSSGCRTPDFSSPATSPCRHNKEEKENYEGESLKNFKVIEEEEEKEQCSPVSVLDPPFEDDDEDDRHEDDDEADDGGFDIECSYAIVQRAKQQLLQKLRRFEKLAGLDPIELEKRLLEEEESDDEELEEEQVEECEDNDDDDDESISSNSAKNVDEFIREILSKSSFKNIRRIPADMKRLVSDLIAEEERGFDDKEVVAKRVCKRLESWREVESNTIDMMVEVDFKRELDGWKKNQEQVGETAMEIELAIFGLLVEELSQD